MIWKLAACLVLVLTISFIGREGYARYQERETMRALESLSTCCPLICSSLDHLRGYGRYTLARVCVIAV